MTDFTRSQLSALSTLYSQGNAIKDVIDMVLGEEELSPETVLVVQNVVAEYPNSTVSKMLNSLVNQQT